MYDGSDILAAFMTWWNANPNVNALTLNKAVWNKEAPEEDIVLPYATYFLVSDPAEVQTTGFAQKRATLQVNFHHSTDAAARALAKTFRQQVRKVPLSIDGSIVMHTLPDGDGLTLGEGLGANGQDCWVAFQMVDIPYTEI